jgi:hypothetical protein
MPNVCSNTRTGLHAGKERNAISLNFENDRIRRTVTRIAWIPFFSWLQTASASLSLLAARSSNSWRYFFVVGKKYKSFFLPSTGSVVEIKFRTIRFRTEGKGLHKLEEGMHGKIKSGFSM